MKSFKNKKIAIIGFGVTGKSAAGFLSKRGAETHVFEGKNREYFSEIDINKYTDTIFHFEQNDFDPSEFDMIVTSPGASLEISVIQKAFQLGIPVHNDLTLFIEEWRNIGKIVGITGSNGKTTVTSLMYECLRDLTPTIIGGNIGKSPLDLLDIKYPENVVAVLEISSNQLDLFENRHYLDVCVVTNLSSNHLDRYHGSMDEYARAKLRGVDYDKTRVIICADDIGTQKHVIPNLKAKHIFPVSFETPIDQVFVAGTYINSDSDLVFRKDKKSDFEVILSNPENRKMIGVHNLYNIAFVLSAIKLLNLSITDKVTQIIRNYVGLEHRIELVAQKNGILYVNDSKSTSPDATRVALVAVGKDQKTILIAGGDDKDMDFEFLKPLFEEKLKHFILLPGNLDKKLKSLVSRCENISITEVSDLKSAVEQACKFAQKGDVVLLSPGSYSKNYFKSFEDRGNQFKKLVKEL